MYNGGTMTYWDTAANASATLNLNGIPELAGFMKLLSSLGNNCSFKVENGMVTALIARPSC